LCSAIAEPGRSFVFTYKVQVRDVPPSARRVDLWLPVPRQTEHQRILSLDVTAPVKGEFTHESVYGNRLWHARFEPPFEETLQVTQRVEVVRLERGEADPDPKTDSLVSKRKSLFLEPNRLVPISERFRRIAEAQTRGKHDTLARARALYDYVLSKMTYDKSGQGWGRGDARYACDVGKGNCTDFHSLFIALSRSSNIPARFWIGFPIPEDRGEGRVGGYHCWAEFWVPGRGWVPVDISEADKHPQRAAYYFGHLDANRIVYSLGRDLKLAPPQRGKPLNFFVYPYVEVDGKPWSRVDHAFSYRDVRRPLARPGSQ